MNLRRLYILVLLIFTAFLLNHSHALAQEADLSEVKLNLKRLAEPGATNFSGVGSWFATKNTLSLLFATDNPTDSLVPNSVGIFPLKPNGGMASFKRIINDVVEVRTAAVWFDGDAAAPAAKKRGIVFFVYVTEENGSHEVVLESALVKANGVVKKRRELFRTEFTSIGFDGTLPAPAVSVVNAANQETVGVVFSYPEKASGVLYGQSRAYFMRVKQNGARKGSAVPIPLPDDENGLLALPLDVLLHNGVWQVAMAVEKRISTSKSEKSELLLYSIDTAAAPAAKITSQKIRTPTITGAVQKFPLAQLLPHPSGSGFFCYFIERGLNTDAQKNQGIREVGGLQRFSDGGEKQGTLVELFVDEWQKIIKLPPSHKTGFYSLVFSRLLRSKGNMYYMAMGRSADVVKGGVSFQDSEQEYNLYMLNVETGKTTLLARSARFERDFGGGSPYLLMFNGRLSVLFRVGERFSYDSHLYYATYAP